MKYIIATSGKQKLGVLIDFPHELCKNNPDYVPELFIAYNDRKFTGRIDSCALLIGGFGDIVYRKCSVFEN